MADISIHAPLAGCDQSNGAFGLCSRISIHAPLAGCDAYQRPPWPGGRHFNPRTPCGVRQNVVNADGSQPYFNPRTPCGVRRDRPAQGAQCVLISIHAPLAGCDAESPSAASGKYSISIHAPLAGCDRPTGGTTRVTDISIHAPLAGCDVIPAAIRHSFKHFNPRTPCGVRQGESGAKSYMVAFQSTHPLRGATSSDVLSDSRLPFQSTHPLRGATRGGVHQPQHHGISIHAPLAGCDDGLDRLAYRRHGFQSTHPLRGATTPLQLLMVLVLFQSTHPLRGATLVKFDRALVLGHFNPRTPCGVRPARVTLSTRLTAISIHAPLAGCDDRRGRSECFV